MPSSTGRGRAPQHRAQAGVLGLGQAVRGRRGGGGQRRPHGPPRARGPIGARIRTPGRPVPQRHVGQSKQRDQKRPGGEPADMGPPRHTFPAAGIEQGIQQIEPDPAAQHHHRRQADGDDPQQQAPDPDPGMEDEIAAEHAGDRPAGADRGDRRARRAGCVGEPRNDPAQQVEDDEPPVAHRVLDIVAEHPQKHHVADQVQPAAVQEQAGQQRRCGRRRGEPRRETGAAPQDAGHDAEAVHRRRAGIGGQTRLPDEDQQGRPRSVLS